MGYPFHRRNCIVSAASTSSIASTPDELLDRDGRGKMPADDRAVPVRMRIKILHARFTQVRQITLQQREFIVFHHPLLLEVRPSRHDEGIVPCSYSGNFE